MDHASPARHQRGPPRLYDRGVSGDHASAPGPPGDEPAGDPRLERAEERLAVPVIVAAVASIPAVFLTMLDGPAAQAGVVLNWASLTVLAIESVLLFWLAADRRRWLRENVFLVSITVVALLAVVFAVGPLQLLRLVRFVGAIRLIRVNRILKAGRILRQRADLEGPWRNALAIGVTVIAAVFVAVILADDTSTSRQALDSVLDRFGPWPVLTAGAILAAATFVAVRYRKQR